MSMKGGSAASGSPARMANPPRSLSMRKRRGLGGRGGGDGVGPVPGFTKGFSRPGRHNVVFVGRRGDREEVDSDGRIGLLLGLIDDFEQL